jgi:hypothetical protein
MSTAAEQIEQFFQGGAAAAKFPDREYGTVIGGEIIADPRMQQQRDYTTGEPITYQDGNPAMQMVIVVQTSLHDPSLPDDDGPRAVYVKGQMRQAVGEALKRAGVTAPRRGGKLWLKYTEDKPVTLKNGKPGNPQKIFAAKYEPPAQAAAAEFFGDDQGAQAAPPTAVDALGGGPILSCPPGVEPAKWAQMTTPQREQMYDALGLTRPAPVAAGAFRDEPPF